MISGHGPDLLDDALAGLAGERLLLRQALDLALCAPGSGSLWPLRGGPAQVFRGTPDQVRAVRQFVREQLAGHPAAVDAVAVASELAANSAVHSASSQPGGQFLVGVAVTGSRQAAVAVTDQGGPFRPDPAAPGEDAVSGRGLAVVRSLTSTFRICDQPGHRVFIAIIAAVPEASATSATDGGQSRGGTG